MYIVHNQNRLFVKSTLFDKVRAFFMLDIGQNHDIIYTLGQKRGGSAEAGLRDLNGKGTRYERASSIP